MLAATLECAARSAAARRTLQRHRRVTLHVEGTLGTVTAPNGHDAGRRRRCHECRGAPAPLEPAERRGLKQRACALTAQRVECGTSDRPTASALDAPHRREREGEAAPACPAATHPLQVEGGAAESGGAARLKRSVRRRLQEHLGAA